MPVNLQQLKKIFKDHFFYIDGIETPDNLINYSYRPNEFTPELEDRFSNIGDEERQTDAFLTMLCDVVVGWDVEDEEEQNITDDNGKSNTVIIKVPVLFDKDNIQQLKKIPTEIFRQLMVSMMEDIKQKKDQSKELLIG